MKQAVTVHIFGTLAACREGTVDSWRDTAAFARQALSKRFGNQVVVEYYDLFSPEMDRFPEVMTLVATGQGQVPLVFIDGELLSSGGKISLPDIRRRLEAMGIKALLEMQREGKAE
jgi:disulfide oxidoreductase YuzD